MNRTVALVALGASAALLLGCKSMKDGARDHFEEKYSCPKDRITVKKRPDVQAADVMDGPDDQPADDVKQDPARYAEWRKNEADKYSDLDMYEVSGCGHDVFLGCFHPAATDNPGAVNASAVDCIEADTPPNSRGGLRRWGSAGSSCNGQDVVCSFDKKAELHCGSDDRLVIARTCKGPDRCRPAPDGKSVACDHTFADEGDPCNVGDLACSTLTDAELRCDKMQFVKVADCNGPKGCEIAPSKAGTGYSLSCDESVSIGGDLCPEPGRSACTLDKRARLVCKSDGKFAIATMCLGPTGCRALPNAPDNTTTIACDESIGEVGDPCATSNVACNVDGTTLLRCRKGAFAIARKCKCTVVDEVAACR